MALELSHVGSDSGLGPRKATMLYGNTARKYELAGELKMSSGLSIDYIFVHRISDVRPLFFSRTLFS
jgi:hypothetical protein